MSKQFYLSLTIVAALCHGLAGPAQAAVTCGMLVSSDLQLTENLECPGGPALVISASGVSVNLQSHTISGNGAGTAILVGAVSDVSIKNGFIRSFEWAIRLEDSSEIRLRDLSIADVEFGIRGVASRTRVESNTVHSRGLGVSLEGSNNWTVSNIITGTGNFNFDTGIRLRGESQRVVRNAVSGFRQGVLVDAGSVVQGNTVFGNRIGLTISDNRSSGTTSVKNNLFYGNNYGINLFDVVIRGRLKLLENEAAMNNQGGFYLEDINAGSVLLAKNTATANGGHGLSVKTGDADVELRFNNATSNALSGFFADDGTVRRFRGNRALGNMRYGIDAGGAVDEGGNVARSNGNQSQCVGVVCN